MERPYAFAPEHWIQMFEEGDLPMDRPVGILVNGAYCSFLDRYEYTDMGYVRNREKEYEKRYERIRAALLP